MAGAAASPLTMLPPAVFWLPWAWLMLISLSAAFVAIAVLSVVYAGISTLLELPPTPAGVYWAHRGGAEGENSHFVGEFLSLVQGLGTGTIAYLAVGTAVSMNQWTDVVYLLIGAGDYLGFLVACMATSLVAVQGLYLVATEPERPTT